MDTGLHFDYYCSLRAPVPGLICFLGIYIELGNEGLNIVLIFDDQEASIGFLGKGSFILALCDLSLA